MTLLLLIGSYVLGSIPTGVLLGRVRGIDPRHGGSGNIGATNVARTAGRWLGLLTLIGDALKGAIPALIASSLSSDARVAAAAGAVAIAGHLWSCFLEFHGGKGVATALGVFLVLAPQAVAVAFVGFVLAFLITRYVSLASLIAVSLLPLAVFVIDVGAPTRTAALCAALAITAKHRDNIARLRSGTEPQFGAKRGA